MNSSYFSSLTSQSLRHLPYSHAHHQLHSKHSVPLVERIIVQFTKLTSRTPDYYYYMYGVCTGRYKIQ